MDYYVEIVNDQTQEVVKAMGPMSEHSADKVADGASINLNHDDYFVRVVQR